MNFVNKFRYFRISFSLYLLFKQMDPKNLAKWEDGIPGGIN